MSKGKLNNKDVLVARWRHSAKARGPKVLVALLAVRTMGDMSGREI